MLFQNNVSSTLRFQTSPRWRYRHRAYRRCSILAPTKTITGILLIRVCANLEVFVATTERTVSLRPTASENHEAFNWLIASSKFRRPVALISVNLSSGNVFYGFRVFFMEVRVEYDYKAEERDELTIKQGDIITNVSQFEEGWFIGTLNGKEGVFPDNFVKVDSYFIEFRRHLDN
ncbi:unnamed protein product [Schistocephalus solidus]|uniref:SH3 domain-containing protein n=1 Tax=Schistocephalus solidus TaxID=70667 RepID=A0A183TCZ4_SCHSO|nr:unnamed protein product [Schistocephalus solidus]